MTTPLRIQYVSAPAGSGKTHQLQHLATKLVGSDNRKVLIAQPTKQLIAQTAKAIQAANPNIKVHTIFSLGDGSAVLPRIEQHMRDADKSVGQVLLITHEALKRLPNAYRVHWDLFVDEIPAVFECIPLKVVKTHSYLTQHLALEEVASGISGVKIAVGQANAIEGLNRNESEDELIGHFGEITNHLLDDNRTVMVKTAEFNSLLDGTKDKGEVNFFSILDAGFVDGYNSVTFMGANAKDTELFILWKQLKLATFVQHKTLAKGLRYQAHENGSRLTVHYLFENEWTKSRSTMVDAQTGMTMLEGVGKYIQDFYANQRFLWVANKAADMAMFDQNDRLPPVSHGLNKPHFMNCNAVASMIALVHNLASASFLKMLGLTDHQVRTIICYQAEYQAVMRCSLRKPDAIAPVTIIVPSRSSAVWIADKFDGCTVSKLETGLDWEVGKAGRPANGKTAMSSAERVRAYRQRQKAKLSK